MIPFLPTELYQSIVEHLSNQQDLARCCSTSKQFLSIAQPLLYRSLSFVFNRYCVPTVISGGVYTSWQLRTTPSRILTTLRDNVHLRRHVRQVHLLQADNASKSIHYIDMGPKMLLTELTNLLLEVRSFVVDNSIFSAGLDSFIGGLQASFRERDNIEGGEGGGGEVGFRLSRWDSPDPHRKLFASYEGFECSPYAVNWSDWRIEEILFTSKDTLRFLSAPVEDITTLAIFSRLERLSLRFAARGPGQYVELLSRLLPSASSPRSLHLTGTAYRQDLVELLTGGKVAKSLPPLLSCLSLNYRVRPEHLFSFLHDLPDSTSLKRVNCLKETGFDGEYVTTQGDEQDQSSKELDIVEEYRKRGIRLVYDEKWELW